MMTSLVTLHLDDNDIGAEGAKALSEALPMMTSLDTLTLRNNWIEDEMFELIKGILENNRRWLRRRPLLLLSKALSNLLLLSTNESHITHALMMKDIVRLVAKYL